MPLVMIKLQYTDQGMQIAQALERLESAVPGTQVRVQMDPSEQGAPGDGAPMTGPQGPGAGPPSLPGAGASPLGATPLSGPSPTPLQPPTPNLAGRLGGGLPQPGGPPPGGPMGGPPRMAGMRRKRLPTNA
jgi:hypothetical protein